MREEHDAEPRLTWAGLIAGAIFWFGLNVMLAYEIKCAASFSCGGGTLVMHGLLVMGFLVPTVFCARFVSVILGGKDIL